MEDDICEAFRELFTKHWANCLGTTCVIGSDKQESIFNLTFVFEYLRVHWSVLGKKNSISVCPWWGRKKKKILPTNLAPGGRKFSQLLLISQDWCLILKIWEEQTFENLWVLPEIIFNSLFLLGGPWVNDPGCLHCWSPAVYCWLLLANFGLRLSFKVLYIWVFFHDKYVGNHKPDVLLSASFPVYQGIFITALE